MKGLCSVERRPDRRRIDQIGQIRAFRKCAVDVSQRRTSQVHPALVVEQASEADRGSKFPAPAALPARDVDGLPEEPFGCDTLLGRFCQRQLAFESVELGFVAAVIVAGGDCKPLVQCLRCVRKSTGSCAGVAEHAIGTRDLRPCGGAPNGYKYSSHVEDKEALKKVKVGDRLDITWTTAVLISVDAPK